MRKIVLVIILGIMLNENINLYGLGNLEELNKNIDLQNNIISLNSGNSNDNIDLQR